ncbi:hypothetical protein C8J56DRAFT_1055487 [Mycena floridula]|nr:hypothetical protein C8J56DRAFT_1055487 [Mycena floridula]
MESVLDPNSFVDSDADLTLPELHLCLHHFLCCFAGLCPGKPMNPEVERQCAHQDRVQVCLGTHNNFANIGRFLLFCRNDDHDHIYNYCWGTLGPFHGYITPPLTTVQLNRLGAIRDEILHCPGGHWGASIFTQRENDGTDDEA